MKQIDTIEQKNFADGRITDVDVSSGRKMQAHAFDELGRSAYGAADVLNRVRIKQQRLQTAQFETDLANYDTDFTNNLDKTDWETVKADDLLKEYSEGMDKLGKEKLGAKGYETWKKERGYGYKENASLKLAENISDKMEKFNFQKYSDLASQKAVFAVNNPKESQGIIEDFFSTLDDSVDNTTVREQIKQNFNEEYAAASAARDVRTAPATALKKLQNAEEYKGLGAVQRERLIEAAQREIKARQGTALEEQVNKALEEAKELYNTDIAKFQNYVEDYAKTLYENQDTGDGLSRQQAHIKLNFMRKLLEGDVLAMGMEAENKRQEKINQLWTFEEFKRDFNAFGWDKKKEIFTEKDIATLQGMTDFIFKIDDALKSRMFGESESTDKELLEMKGKLYSEIGRLAVEDDKRLKGPSNFEKGNKKLIENSVQWDFLNINFPLVTSDLDTPLNQEFHFNDFTNEQYLKEAVRNVFYNPTDWNALGGEDKKLGKKNLGRLYINAYRAAKKAGINLNAADEGKKQINDIVHNAKDTLIGELHHLPNGKYDAAIVNGGVVKLPQAEKDKLAAQQAVDIDDFEKL